MKKKILGYLDFLKIILLFFFLTLLRFKDALWLELRGPIDGRTTFESGAIEGTHLLLSTETQKTELIEGGGEKGENRQREKRE